MAESLTFDKSKYFAIRIVKLFNYLCKEKHEYIMSKQLMRCGTSIGANLAEALYGISRKDFQVVHLVKRMRRDQVLARISPQDRLPL